MRTCKARGWRFGVGVQGVGFVVSVRVEGFHGFRVEDFYGSGVESIGSVIRVWGLG